MHTPQGYRGVSCFLCRTGVCQLTWFTEPGPSPRKCYLDQWVGENELLERGYTRPQQALRATTSAGDQAARGKAGQAEDTQQRRVWSVLQLPHVQGFLADRGSYSHDEDLHRPASVRRGRGG
jgi:hypothetical protein